MSGLPTLGVRGFIAVFATISMVVAPGLSELKDIMLVPGPAEQSSKRAGQNPTQIEVDLRYRDALLHDYHRSVPRKSRAQVDAEDTTYHSAR